MAFAAGGALPKRILKVRWTVGVGVSRYVLHGGLLLER